MRKFLEDATEDELNKQLEHRRLRRGSMLRESPIGNWRLSTGGDVEGKSSVTIAEETGHIGELVLKYAGQASWQLRGELLRSDWRPDPKTCVSVSAGTFLGKYSSTVTVEECAAIQNFLGPEYVVNISGLYACVDISRAKRAKRKP